MKREVRCNPGAIPVAVMASLKENILVSSPLSIRDGKEAKMGPSQKTCRMESVNGLSGEKPEMHQYALAYRIPFPDPFH